MRQYFGLAAIGLIAVCGGCGTVTVKHEVSHIYATVDVNIRIQQELERIFDYEEARGGVISELPTETASEGGSR